MTKEVLADADSAAKSVMKAWLAQLKDIGARRTIPEKIASTDHLSFIAVGTYVAAMRAAPFPARRSCHDLHRSQRPISAKYAAA
ncbi:MAG: hypothetical protein ABI446_10395 [Gemmatimonadaceae bacterium]